MATALDWQVFYNTRTFRLLLDCMARPGKYNKLPIFADTFPPYQVEHEAPKHVNSFALGALLSLLDREVSFTVAAHGEWLPRESALMQWMSLCTNSGTTAPEKAHFVLFGDDACAELVSQLHIGTLLEPENSATAFVCVDRLVQLGAHEEGGRIDEGGLQLTLSGPGIEHTHEIVLWGLSQSMYHALQQARQGYPLGIDLYLVDQEGGCIGLPRTTQISMREHTEEVKA
ncbi:phosphonate C-P lyase system protein PhnH [Ktedonospora formicarum]|uniref:Phosphonate C-P lyase system protein PhnH n=1 Tax=Ktedonospora formicarum TaxID=2778364 RepID=A0A8J3HWL8_9CHLR|nr:phosphonate C-P lyase system protein PhnH [Ktedonospora formicarum]GHO41958.1 phosphonate C-P lyase system protein PhnH [Ktedonospora formicarum]